MSIVITGASGFIGAHLAVGLSQLAQRVVSLAGSKPCTAEVVRASEQVYQLDLTDGKNTTELLQTLSPQVVIHAAALAKPLLCEKNPDAAEKANVAASKHLLSCLAAKKNPPLFIYLSTDLVFGGRVPPPGGFTEEDSPEPCSVYACTKYQAEQAVLGYVGRSVVFRICLCYGRKIGNAESFLGWLCSGLSTGKETHLFVDEWRTPVLVDDITLCVANLIEKSSTLDFPRLYHIAGAERVSRYELGLQVADIFGYPKELIIPRHQSDVESIAPRSADASLSCWRMQSELGVSPRALCPGLTALCT